MFKSEKWLNNGIEMLSEEFGEEKVKKAISAVEKFEVEIPSWALGKFGGGRFAGYIPPAPARNIEEKLDDISFIHKLTGATPRVATHILWDFSKDEYEPNFEIAKYVSKIAKEKGLLLGAVNPTYFLKGSHRGSFSSIEEKTRKRYIEQTILGGKIAEELGNKLLTLWFPDGSLYPGQIELKDTYEILKNSLKECYEKISKQVKILIEYKLFEPGTYSTIIPDWATAFILGRNLGENVGVLIDLGHHPHGTNVEQIVAKLISEKVPFGFHFNTRYSADDDHSVEPNPEIARIFYELVKGEVIVNPETSKNYWYMLDQCSSRENRIQSLIHSVDSLQISLAKAVLVDRENLKKYQDEDEIILANRLFNDAIINADVRPIVAKARLNKNLPVDPIRAYTESGYQEKIEKERRE